MLQLEAPALTGPRLKSPVVNLDDDHASADEATSAVEIRQIDAHCLVASCVTPTLRHGAISKPSRPASRPSPIIQAPAVECSGVKPRHSGDARGTWCAIQNSCAVPRDVRAPEWFSADGPRPVDHQKFGCPWKVRYLSQQPFVLAQVRGSIDVVAALSDGNKDDCADQKRQCSAAPPNHVLTVISDVLVRKTGAGTSAASRKAAMATIT